jgi:hypothetical protein
MSQTTKEMNEVIATWISPRGLVNNEANAEKIIRYVGENGAFFSHANLNQAVENMRSQLEWEMPKIPAPRVRPDPPNIGDGSLKNHRNHKEVAAEARQENSGALTVLQEIQGVMRKLEAERVNSNPLTIYKNGRIDHAATQDARAKAAKK